MRTGHGRPNPLAPHNPTAPRAGARRDTVSAHAKSKAKPKMSSPADSATTPVAAPINWANTLMFVVTLGLALTVVPWYGFAHGYSLSAWVVAGLFLVANEMSVTAGYHRLWAHRAYDAHWLLR